MKKKTLKRMIKKSIKESKPVINKLDDDILLYGFCMYEMNKNGTVYYVDPFDLRIIEHYEI